MEGTSLLGNVLGTCNNGFKLNEEWFRFDNRKEFFTPRVVRPRPRLPREAVGAPSLNVFKADDPQAIWSSAQQLCPQQRVGTRWSLKFLPTSDILWCMGFRVNRFVYSRSVQISARTKFLQYQKWRSIILLKLRTVYCENVAICEILLRDT